MIEDDSDFLLKIVLIGDSGVGKTNLLSRFTKNSFDENTRNTIGVDFSSFDMDVNGKKVKTQFWDTAGQEKYRAIATAYYKNAHGAIIVYDVTRQETFKNVEKWLKELRENGESSMRIIVIGNKSDLDEHRQVSSEEGTKFSQAMGLFFLETSAKTNPEEGVNKAFRILVEEVIEAIEANNKRMKTDYLNSRGNSLHSKSKIEQTEKKKCC